MHAVMITFRSTAPLEDLRGPLEDFAQALGAVPGFVSKAWLADGQTFGGFYLFSDRASAERYLGSELVAGLQAMPAFTGFEVRLFDVLDELSRSTGIAPPAQESMQPA